MRVLSLFDGISCGRVALERAGIPVETYYASEIHQPPITVAQKNYPSTIQLGDVTKVDGTQLGEIDLLIGGSPCQGFSFAGKQLNFEDPRSKLFFEYVRILEEVKPKYFLLENVVMKKEYQDVISKYLGVQPIMIDSSLVSAQSRRRLYWTNIPDIVMPRDKGILLKDIVHETADLDKAMGESWARWFKERADYLLSKKYVAINPDKAVTMTARQYASWQGNFVMECLKEYIVPFTDTLKVLDKEVQSGKMGFFRKDSQANRVYYLNNKAATLCGDAGGGAAKMGQYLFGSVLPTEVIIKEPRVVEFTEGQKFYTLTEKNDRGVLVEGYIRKLTPIECERLQTLPDNYTAGISDAQRYKALGNGWTVDVIAHILKHIIV